MYFDSSIIVLGYHSRVKVAFILSGPSIRYIWRNWFPGHCECKKEKYSVQMCHSTTVHIDIEFVQRFDVLWIRKRRPTIWMCRRCSSRSWSTRTWWSSKDIGRTLFVQRSAQGPRRWCESVRCRSTVGCTTSLCCEQNIINRRFASGGFLEGGRRWGISLPKRYLS